MKYVGTELVESEAMTRLDYNVYRGWTLPSDENGEDKGYKLTTESREYWVPKAVFEKTYVKSEGMSFGHTLLLLKIGIKLQRKGWNGKGMYIYYIPAAKYPASGNTLGTMKGVFPDDMVPYQAYIAMKTADNTVVPWLCSQSDLLAQDWEEVQ